MTTVTDRRWHPADDYDDKARWLDDTDGGDRWRAYGACRAEGVDPELFFPVVVRQERRTERRGDELVEVVVDVPTDEEPPYPPPEAKAICDRCPVIGRCLERYMDEDAGIFGGLTAYQRGLMNKKVVRKRCLACSSTDLVTNATQRKEICLRCGYSWDIM